MAIYFCLESIKYVHLLKCYSVKSQMVCLYGESELDGLSSVWMYKLEFLKW